MSLRGWLQLEACTDPRANRFAFARATVCCPVTIFANFVHLLTGGRRPVNDPGGFIEDVRQTDTERPNPRVERVILVCWLLIALKHAIVLWAVYRYRVPFNALWVNLPTWLLGVLATTIYYLRVGRRR